MRTDKERYTSERVYKMMEHPWKSKFKRRRNLVEDRRWFPLDKGETRLEWEKEWGNLQDSPKDTNANIKHFNQNKRQSDIRGGSVPDQVVRKNTRVGDKTTEQESLQVKCQLVSTRRS